jgi:hypothetical protein
MQDKAKEAYGEYRERLEQERYKNASAFLQKCRGAGLSVYETSKTLEKAHELLELFTDLDGGLKLPEEG